MLRRNLEGVGVAAKSQTKDLRSAPGLIDCSSKNEGRDEEGRREEAKLRTIRTSFYMAILLYPVPSIVASIPAEPMADH
jgi:hypothetical protein